MVAHLTTTEVTASRHSKTLQKPRHSTTTHFTEYHPKFALKTMIPHTGGVANRCMESASTCTIGVLVALNAPTKPIVMLMAEVYQINGHLALSSCNSFLLK